MEPSTEMLKGILEGCVLELIGRGETYGYAITRQIQDLGFSSVVEGTVYTILVRLEKNHLVDVEKRPSALGPPRKFYVLNQAGAGGAAPVLGQMGISGREAHQSAGGQRT